MASQNYMSKNNGYGLLVSIGVKHMSSALELRYVCGTVVS